jgi:hypothetical protein
MDLEGIQAWIWIAGSGAVGILLTVGLVSLFRWLRDEEQGYPGEQQIEAALLPLIQHAIMAAFKLSESSMDELGKRLDGVDKAALARYVYNLLPDDIPIGENATLPLGFIKLIITEDRFAELVQMGYDEFAEWFEGIRDKFNEGFEDIMEPDSASAVIKRAAL